jgi:hypothetical protein
MNTYEKAIQNSLENIQATPDEKLKERVMQSATDGVTDYHVYRRRFPARVAVIAAVIAVFLFATAATYGTEIIGAIKQIVFGESTATQIVSDDGIYVGSWGVMNRGSLSEDRNYPLGDFKRGDFETIEEALQAAPFPIRLPVYLPENVTGLEDVGVWRVEESNGPDMHFVILSYNIALRDDGCSILQLRETYAGPEAYFSVETVSPIEKVMVGDAEAVLISTYGKSDFGNGDIITNVDDVGYTLYWLYDGIAYELSADYHDGFTPEIMIKIAESIR